MFTFLAAFFFLSSSEESSLLEEAASDDDDELESDDESRTAAACNEPELLSIMIVTRFLDSIVFNYRFQSIFGSIDHTTP